MLLLNLGRLTTYICAGILFASLGTSILGYVDLPVITHATRIFTAIVLILLGIQLLLKRHRPFSQIERVGAWLWELVNKIGVKTDSNKLSQTYLRGLIWGFLPCGLLYAVLLTTIFANDPMQGGLVMLGFGFGTLPVMLLTGSLYQYISSWVRHRAAQWLGGVIFIQGGLLMLIAPYLVNMDFMQAYPQLMSTMFCLN